MERLTLPAALNKYEPWPYPHWPTLVTFFGIVRTNLFDKSGHGENGENVRVEFREIKNSAVWRQSPLPGELSRWERSYGCGGARPVESFGVIKNADRAGSTGREAVRIGHSHETVMVEKLNANRRGSNWRSR